MRILKILSIQSLNFNPDIDVLNVEVEFDDGKIGSSFVYRATYNLDIKIQELIDKYNIPKNELKTLLELSTRANEADHYYDEKD